jgi:Common central domain of tyrosinase/Polyphenol oxidase middle domain
MKKIILLSVSMLCGILLLVGFSTKIKKISVISKPAVSIVNCLPPAAPALITAAAFKAKYEPNVIRVRKNVDALTNDEINAIKVGILKMRSLPYTDPTSMGYQVAIHGTTMTDNLPSWNSCHMANQSFFFFAWHRMYIYFFERILRAKSGRNNLTLPYWNYQVNPVLHPAYRDNSRGNPLYDPTRNPTINAGGALPASIQTAFSNSLDIIPFYTFQTNLNGGPHGSVHTTVNGNMAVVTTAAKDPVFWLHHSNIDRLWEQWLSMCGGRATPVDSTWLNTTYTFFDETGTAVSMKGSQVVLIATQLNYKYDSLPATPNCSAARVSQTMLYSQQLLSKSSAVELNGQSLKTNFLQESTTQLDSFIKKNGRTNFKFTNKTTPEALIMSFEGVTIDQIPQGVVEVYLNLPAGTTPVATSKYFVGLLDLFSAEHFAMHISKAKNNKDRIELDVSKVAQALNLTLSDLKNAEVSFYVRGSTLNGKEVPVTAQLTIQRIKFFTDEFKR